MKLKLSLLLTFLMIQNSFANHYDLSAQSKQRIAIAAAIGGTIGGGLGYITYLDEHKYDAPSHQDKTLWQKIKDFPWAYVMIPATLGAAVSGLVTYYCFTPEKTQEWCENTLMGYDFELRAIENASSQELKGYHASRFPTVAACDRLARWQQSLLRVRDNLTNVLKSGIEPLFAGAQACLEKVDHYEKALAHKIINLTSDPAYLYELHVRNMEAMLRMQADLVNIAMREAHRPRPVVVIHQRPPFRP